jgi:hypothetical protein
LSILANVIAFFRRQPDWDAGFRKVCRSVFRITVEHGGGRYTGTGFVAAKYRRQDSKNGFILATAEHVFRPLRGYETVFWRVERFTWRGDGDGWSTFKSNLELLGDSPIRAHLTTDVGLLIVPQTDDYVVEPLHLCDPRVGVVPGTEVGWVGFPAFVREEFPVSVPCFFRGVVSAVIDTTATDDGRLLYLVDGHGAQGVSGGPVWVWNPARSRAEVIGLCSRYMWKGGSPEPGLVVVEAVNPLVGFLRRSAELEVRVIMARGPVRPGSLVHGRGT